MSRRLSYLLPGFLVIALLLALWLSWAMLRKNRLDDSSSELVVMVTESIFTSDSAQALIDSAHASLLEQMNPQSLRSYIDSIPSRIGPLESIDAISGSSNASMMPFTTEPIVANYRVELVFGENAVAALVELIYDQDRWQITSYVIDTPMLYN